MRFRVPFRRFRRCLLAFQREERGIESIEWMTTGLIICALIIYFAEGLTDPLISMLFDALGTVNAG